MENRGRRVHGSKRKTASAGRWMMGVRVGGWTDSARLCQAVQCAVSDEQNRIAACPGGGGHRPGGSSGACAGGDHCRDCGSKCQEGPAGPLFQRAGMAVMGWIVCCWLLFGVACTCVHASQPAPECCLVQIHPLVSGRIDKTCLEREGGDALNTWPPVGTNSSRGQPLSALRGSLTPSLSLGIHLLRV